MNEYSAIQRSEVTGLTKTIQYRQLDFAVRDIADIISVTNKRISSAFLSFNGDLQSSSLTYEMVAAFPFPGTSVISSISKINAILRKNGSATSVSMRIYDATNAQTIAEVLNVTNQDNTIITSLGVISNLPENEATFEIHLLRTGGPGGARAFCSGIEIRT